MYSGQYDDSPSSPTKIRPFHEFDAIFAGQDEKPLLMVERLENRLIAIEHRVEKLESRLDAVLSTMEDMVGRVDTLSEIFQDVIRKEMRAMEILGCSNNP